MRISALIDQLQAHREKFGDVDVLVEADRVLELLSTSEGLPYQFNGARRLRFEERDCGYETPCWVWLLQLINGRPYLKVGTSTRKLNAHRWFYEKIIGPIPEGNVLHHRCENKLCVNPFHMEPKTRAQHQSDHALGRKLNLSDAERERRREHGKKMAKHMLGKSYKTASRSEAVKKGWEKRRRAS